MTEHKHYGVLGGSFDPIHYGHLALAETARVQLGLEQVLFVPAGHPPHKDSFMLSAPEHRLAMLDLAIQGNPAFAISRVDLERPGPHYTVEMLNIIREQMPDVTRWYFLMGEDALHDLASWRNPEEILQQVTLAVMPRAGKRADVLALRARFPLLAERLVWLDVPPVYYSATELRLRVRKGLPLRYLVAPEVETYLREQALYT